jgi:hypothetical protein
VEALREAAPGHQLQIDVKFVEPITTDAGRRKRCYQYTAIDDCTRLRILRIYPRSDQKTAIQFLRLSPLSGSWRERWWCPEQAHEPGQLQS